MYGFNIVKNGKPGYPCERQITKKNTKIQNFMIRKFENDKVFYESEDYVLVLDGVILNRKELCPDSNWADYIISSYIDNGDSFFKEFEGCFAGALYDVKRDRWIVFTDHFGQKFVYYSLVNNTFFCSEMMDIQYRNLKNSGVKYGIDEVGAKMLLSYGFMLENHTICDKIKKIRPGCFIVYENNTIIEFEYYRVENTPNEKLTEEEIIEEIDEKFKLAVKLQFEKDKEYGYNHVTALSGGLDCRMTTWVANRLGYKKQLNITFSQTDYLDETLAKQMAEYLKHEWLFKALDNGLWLFDLEEITRRTGGNVLYYGTAHGNSLMKYMNFEGMGMIHSGQLGDVTLGVKKGAYRPYKVGTGAFSTKFVDSVKKYIQDNYKNQEQGLWYCRYLNGTNNGLQNIYNYTETCSPFLNKKFVEFCLSIPEKFRTDHFIYKKWILAKYPDAANFEWESTGQKITANTITIAGREIYVRNLWKTIVVHVKMALGIDAKATNTRMHMNPVGYYISQNKELSAFIDSYFNSDYSSRTTPEIQQIINDISTKGTSMEKIQCVTLLSAIKLYYHE